MDNLTITKQIGFSFSDSNHYITANEYRIIMKEIANYLNNLYNTKNITVVYDSDVVGSEVVFKLYILDGYLVIKQLYITFNNLVIGKYHY